MTNDECSILLELLTKRLAALIYDYDIVNDIMILTDNDGNERTIEDYRKKMCRVQKIVVHPDFLAVLLSIYAGHSTESGPILLDISHRPSGKFSWYEIASKPFFDDNKHIMRTIGVIWKVNPPYNMIEEHIHFRSDQDPITGLLNVQGMKKAVDNYLSKSGRHFIHAVIMIQFCCIPPSDNSEDERKHVLSEYALNSFGQKIKSAFRSEDLQAYAGNKIFLIFMKNIKNDIMVKNKINDIEKILKLSNKSVCIPEADYYLGEAVYPTDGSCYEDLIKMAAEKIKKSKKNDSDE